MLGGEDLNQVAMEGNETLPLVQYENVVFPFKMTTSNTLKELAKEMGVQYTGAKKILWNRIIESGHQSILRRANDGQSFTFRRKKAAEGSVPRWVVLTPEPVPPVANIDMATGAERGFFGPTNPNNSVGATRSNFCTLVGDQISRPEFGPKKPPSEEPFDALPVFGPAPRPDPVNEKGHPSKAVYSVIGDVRYSRPKDYFDLQLSPKFFSNIRKGTNHRACAEGVGLGVTGREMKDYGDYVAFDDAEIYKFVGLMFANDLMPKPNFESWFKSLPTRPLYSSNFISGGVFD